MTSATATATAATTRPLQMLNYANMLAFLLNCAITFGADTVLQLPNNAILSLKYQTLITPAPYAFAIWGIIFTSQLVWTLAQFCVPRYRTNDWVVRGVGYNYVAACVAQCAWTFCFGYERMLLSLIAMLAILLPLVRIVTTMRTMTTSTTLGQYWIFQFPFELHAGWIMAATLVNVNVVVVAAQAAADVQTWCGGVSLVVVLGVGLGYTLRTPQQLVIPCVLIWAAVAIGAELTTPRDLITTTFAASTIQHTRLAAKIIGTILSCAVVINLFRTRVLKHQPGSSTNASEANDRNGGSYSALS